MRSASGPESRARYFAMSPDVQVQGEGELPSAEARPQGHELNAFLPLRLTAEKPRSYKYPKNPVTLGEHIRRKRMDLGLCQEDVARRLGADTGSVRNWETGRSLPADRFIPGIVRFLGCDPRLKPWTLGQAIRYYRQSLGLSQHALADLIGANKDALRGWETGDHEPSPYSLAKLKRQFPDLARFLPEDSAGRLQVPDGRDRAVRSLRGR